MAGLDFINREVTGLERLRLQYIFVLNHYYYYYLIIVLVRSIIRTTVLG